MDNLESKKLALIRIWQILLENSDSDHPMTQAEISQHLEQEYGIAIERKAISRNITLLKEAGVEIASCRGGSYIEYRDFEDSELHMLIDGVLSSKHITSKQSKNLIDRLCGLSNKYFKASVRHIYSVNDWSKTDNQALFYNIELIDSAIETKRQIHYDYNKYGIDKKLHRSSQQYVSPYQMILHNQRYYLMAYSEYWGNMVFHRLDHITNMTITDKKATPLRSISGYEQGINYKNLSSAMPYMFPDKLEQIVFVADSYIVDQIVDWFGDNAKIISTGNPDKVQVSLQASTKAMEFWALQFLEHVEIISPESLRNRIRDILENELNKYKSHS